LIGRTIINTDRIFFIRDILFSEFPAGGNMIVMPSGQIIVFDKALLQCPAGPNEFSLDSSLAFS